MSCNHNKLINNQRLADIGPALDDGGSVDFANSIEWLAYTTHQTTHLEQLSLPYARWVLPRELAAGEDQR
jgi:hypothetical protein